MIDPALSGLSRLLDAQGQGANQTLVAGLARFGAGLVETPRDRRDFLRRWWALKARLPRTGKTWHSLWQVALTNLHYRDKPFVGWLQEAEPAFRESYKKSDVVSVPPNISEIIRDLAKRAQKPDQRPHVLVAHQRGLPRPPAMPTSWSVPPATRAMRCCPGRRAIPSFGPGMPCASPPTMDMPGTCAAAHCKASATRTPPPRPSTGRQIRRLPDDPVLRNQLARLLQGQGREQEAEDLFRQTLDRDPSDTVAANELARLLVHTGREDEAEKLLDRVFEDLPHHNPVVLYSLALIRIAGGRPEAAVPLHARYVQAFGNDTRSATLGRLLDAGSAGVEGARRRLANNLPDAGADGQEARKSEGNPASHTGGGGDTPHGLGYRGRQARGGASR